MTTPQEALSNYIARKVAADPSASIEAVIERKIGDRVQAHPATDAWMSGDRYGTVTKIFSFAPRTVHVKMDKSGKVRKFSEVDLLNI